MRRVGSLLEALRSIVQPPHPRLVLESQTIRFQHQECPGLGDVSWPLATSAAHLVRRWRDDARRPHELSEMSDWRPTLILRRGEFFVLMMSRKYTRDPDCETRRSATGTPSPISALALITASRSVIFPAQASSKPPLDSRSDRRTLLGDQPCELQGHASSNLHFTFSLSFPRFPRPPPPRRSRGFMGNLFSRTFTEFPKQIHHPAVNYAMDG